MTVCESQFYSIITFGMITTIIEMRILVYLFIIIYIY